MGDVKKGLRTVRNVVRNYNDAQVKVREATSNDPWGPAASLMSEIADMTYNHLAFSDIMQMLWKRLNDNGKDWRHVYKALVVLDYIIKAGSDKVAQHCKENLYFIQTLQNFQFFEENKDHGMNVREKAKQVCGLLTDEEKLKNERVKASKTRERFQYGAPGGLMTRGDYGADDTGMSTPSSNPHSGSFGSGGIMSGRNPHLPAEVEVVRPQTANEEEIQLQIALAMSKEEADEEDRRRQRDDVRLQIALNESQSDYQKHKPVAVSSVNELFDVFHDTSAGSPIGPAGGNAADPWGGDHFGLSDARPQPAADGFANGNGAFPSSTLNDPWGGLGGGGPASASSSSSFSGGNLSNGSNVNQNGNVYPSLPSVAAATLNPWSSLQPTSGSNSATASPSNLSAAAKPKNPAQNFLGQNSALVDLESLVSPPTRPAANSAPASVFMNPFTGPFSGGAPAAPINNPFHQAAAPQPTINQLRNINAAPPSGYDSGSLLPQPLVPLSSSPNNSNGFQQHAPNRFQQPQAPVDQNLNPFL